MPDSPFLRLAQAGDERALYRLCRMAMHDKGEFERLRVMAEQTAKFPEDLVETRMTRRSTGSELKARALASTRVMDSGSGSAVGFVYAIPPVGWITKEAGLPMAVAAKVLGSLIEINLLAVLPVYRHQGLGAALLEDCEERYRQAGYRVAMVLLEDRPKVLTRFYEKHGWTVGAVDTPAHVKFWRGRDMWAYYGDISETHRLAFKSLHPECTVEVRKVSAPRWERQGGSLVPVEHALSTPRELVSVQGVLPE